MINGICLACCGRSAVAQIFNLSVSVEIVAIRDDLPDRGLPGRSALEGEWAGEIPPPPIWLEAAAGRMPAVRCGFAAL